MVGEVRWPMGIGWGGNVGMLRPGITAATRGDERPGAVLAQGIGEKDVRLLMGWPRCFVGWG
jgi:hypothetical protein